MSAPSGGEGNGGGEGLGAGERAGGGEGPGACEGPEGGEGPGGGEQAEARFQIINERGLHARAANKLVRVAQRFPCEVTLVHEAERANGKSVMGVLLLCSPKGAWLTVRAEGEGAADAVDAIGAVITDRFGEGA